MTDFPLPENRRSFTAKQRNMVANRQNWLCNICKCDLYGIAFDIDHIHRISALGKHEPENWQALCQPCHAAKTRVDNHEAKKGRRIRGELKPRAKKQIASRPFSPPLIETRESRSPSASFGGGRKLAGRSFAKGLRRKFNGTVERVGE